MEEDVRTTKYLYGCEPNEFSKIQYSEAIEYKIVKGKELLKVLVHDNDMEDVERIKEVSQALSFNQKLLDELS